MTRSVVLQFTTPLKVQGKVSVFENAGRGQALWAQKKARPSEEAQRPTHCDEDALRLTVPAPENALGSPQFSGLETRVPAPSTLHSGGT